MASLVVTPEALSHILRVIEDDEISRPMVAVMWAKGQSDLMRSSAGVPVWTREADSWLATVLDLDEVGPMSGTHPTEQLHGLAFFLVGKPDAPTLEGCTLD